MLDHSPLRGICQQLMRSADKIGPVATSTTSNGRRTGRPAGSPPNREAILASARQQFIAHGYDGATVRGIAAGAGVDAALVHHYFGTKQRLLVTALQQGGPAQQAVEA